ncbi:hypothetical protein DPMN_164356 [Dreissena polymorpha]|uniref:Uncharacterized protein n=1 Tax=Dreissena polymorpha TaxID=45954 RepID=A0A9D4ETK2_DREPO|nr:hypothetical protein DPMN_164356 [Dreissena polymorpha]
MNMLFNSYLGLPSLRFPCKFLVVSQLMILQLKVCTTVLHPAQNPACLLPASPRAYGSFGRG